jgi:hypothetical protein
MTRAPSTPTTRNKDAGADWISEQNEPTCRHMT